MYALWTNNQQKQYSGWRWEVTQDTVATIRIKLWKNGNWANFNEQWQERFRIQGLNVATSESMFCSLLELGFTDPYFWLLWLGDIALSVKWQLCNAEECITEIMNITSARCLNVQLDLLRWSQYRLILYFIHYVTCALIFARPFLKPLLWYTVL